MIAFIAGLIVGGALGVILLALVTANHYDDGGHPL